MADRVGPSIAALGITDATVTNMVHGAVGTLLAGDPSVTAGAPSQIPTPVLKPAPVPVHVVGAPSQVAIAASAPDAPVVKL